MRISRAVAVLGTRFDRVRQRDDGIIEMWTDRPEIAFEAAEMTGPDSVILEDRMGPEKMALIVWASEDEAREIARRIER